ncbi:carcinoembryonic antigen-related cell adhesion molecule 5-like [Anguilla anguilla]|uniref:carcinoembryonic antigen-related cell adhesion molecule 5-like n=1 Tax=Anguilla anguilla TaxID=7936 RepID=UPI0015AE1FFC|nr:carcinoembryonic antigen-related cell adhesion molecule 5-like [Anguilla anguilla]
MDSHTLRLFAVVLLSVVGCSSGQVLPPGSLTGVVGGNVTFKTTISSTSPEPLTITWTFNNGSAPVSVIGSGPAGVTPGLGYEGRVSLNRVTGSLELRQLTLRDSGPYSVVLTSGIGATQTGQTSLNVYEPVSNVTVRANATNLVEFNDTVALTCSALGSSLFYRWHNGSSDITPSERVHLSDDNRILTISSVLRSDRGPLFCTVYNVVSSGTSPPVFLNISFGPDNVQVTVDPSKEFQTPGSNITLSCSAQSSPPAEFKWAFNGTMLNTEGQKLKLENIQENQSGNYTCWAHNIETLRFKPSDPLLISVMEKISGASITGPTEVLIAGTSSAKLSCQATAGTIISRKWLKDGNPLSSSNRITFSGDNSSVSIDPLQGTDNGQYQCRLTNPVSTDSVSYNLTVNYGPEKVVMQGPSEIEVGHTVVLTCSASSVPPATFTWTLNGTETAVITKEFTVENAGFSDSGTYTCVAKNSVTGSNISSAPHVLTVKVPAGPNSESQLGAILGGIFGALACIAVAGGAFFYMKKKKRSSSTATHRGGRNTSNHQSNGGDAELAYADISHFRKADGSKVQLGSVKAQAAAEPGPVATAIPETTYAEVRKN